MGLMLCDVVLEACDDCFVEPSHLPVGLGCKTVFLKCLIRKRQVTAAKNFDTKCGPLIVSKYVGVPYGMTQFSTNTIPALLNGTFGACKTLSSKL